MASVWIHRGVLGGSRRRQQPSTDKVRVLIAPSAGGHPVRHDGDKEADCHDCCGGGIDQALVKRFVGVHGAVGAVAPGLGGLGLRGGRTGLLAG